ncbi:MAG: DsbA family protein [Rhodospirillales bacterium]|nr:MAG: DsbA family protein [Rhodospirillales bacterium]UCH74367.1 MAG: DsbA family protein [Rhodospirillales bacterium]
MSRTVSILAAIVVSLTFLSGCDDSPEEMLLEDRVFGSPDAPITIIEYASLTCGHCATFHKATMPRLKREWLDTGRAKLIYRDFPLDNNAATAAVIARCAPEDQYYRVLGVLFSRQSSWAEMDDPTPVLIQIAESRGLNRQTIEDCLDDDALLDGVLQSRIVGQTQHGVNSTPAFVVGERVITGAMSFRDFDALLRSMARQ